MRVFYYGVIAILGAFTGVQFLNAQLETHESRTILECTETALRMAVSEGGRIIFQCDGTIYLTNTIAITKDTVLDGNGHSVILSGGNAVRIFNVNSNASLELLNLQVKDGLSTHGGAILNYGTTSCSNVLFSNNSAIATIGLDNKASGGAVLNRGFFSATNSTFIGNRALGSIGSNHWVNGTDGAGGAIYNQSVAQVFGCSFITNYAQGGPGVTDWRGYGGDGGDAQGGAVYNVASFASANSTYVENAVIGGDSSARLNSASGGDSWGGGIFNGGGTLLLTNCTFARNTAVGGRVHPDRKSVV